MRGLEVKEVSELLEVRLFSLSLYQKLLGNEPSERLLDVAFSAASYQSLSILESAGNSYRDKLFAYRSAGDTYFADPARVLIGMQREYMLMFIGPDKLKAPPWESVYVSAEPLLFQESTLEVRRIYRRENFVSEGYPSVPDDHIAIELDFLAKTVWRAMEVLEQKDSSEFIKLLMLQKSFIENHLLNWVPALVAAANRIESPVFYPQLLELVLEYLRLEPSIIKTLLTRTV